MELSLSGFIFSFKSSGLSIQNEGAPWGLKPCLLPLWYHGIPQGPRTLWKQKPQAVLFPWLLPCLLWTSALLDLDQFNLHSCLSVRVSPSHLEIFLKLWKLFLSCSFHMRQFGSVQAGNFLGVVLGPWQASIVRPLFWSSWLHWPLGGCWASVCLWMCMEWFAVSLKGKPRPHTAKLGTWLYLVSFSAYAFGFNLWVIHLPVQIRLEASF